MEETGNLKEIMKGSLGVRTFLAGFVVYIKSEF